MAWISRAASAPASNGAPLLEVSRLTKCFGPLTVLRDVSLRVGHGEIVAVAGGNGAGKSTLIGAIARVLDADGGEVRFGGRPMPARPAQVRQAGIETVWQEHGLCDDLDAVANIFLGREHLWGGPLGLLRATSMDEAAVALLHRLGLNCPPETRSLRLWSTSPMVPAPVIVAQPRSMTRLLVEAMPFWMLRFPVSLTISVNNSGFLE